jgi:hypothetical protein
VPVYVSDAPPLIWYAAGAHRQLSRKALRVFNSASLAESLIYVPVFVLWEIAMLLKIGVFRCENRTRFGLRISAYSVDLRCLLKISPFSLKLTPIRLLIPSTV